MWMERKIFKETMDWIFGLIGLVAVFAIYMYSVYFNQDPLNDAKDVTYSGNNVSFSVKEYFKPQNLPAGTNVLNSFNNATSYDYNEVAILLHSEKYKRVGQGERQGNIWIYIYRFVGPASLQDLVNTFKVNAPVMIGQSSDSYDFKVTGERNLTVNGMPATEINYVSYQKADTKSGEKGAIIFIEKTPGSVYYVIRYYANYDSDFQLDKVNYDMILNTFQVQ